MVGRGASTGRDTPAGSGCTGGATEALKLGVPREDDEDDTLILWLDSRLRKSRSVSLSPRRGKEHSAEAWDPEARQASHGAWQSGPWTHLVRNLRQRRQATVPRRRRPGLVSSKPVGVTGDWRGGDPVEELATRMLPPTSGEESRSCSVLMTDRLEPLQLELRNSTN